MSLTKEDLRAIREVVKGEITEIVQPICLRLDRTESSLEQLKHIVLEIAKEQHRMMNDIAFLKERCKDIA